MQTNSCSHTHMPRHHTSVVQALLLVLSLLVGLVFPAASVQAQEPRLIINAPQHVELGQPITIVLSLTAINDLGGYETTARFDATAAIFSTLEQQHTDLRRFGRDIIPLGPVVIPSGVSFGFVSCPVADCRTPTLGSAWHSIPSSHLHLARLTLIPTRQGRLRIALGPTSVVNSAGQRISIGSPDQVIEVQIGTLGEPTIVAPPNTGSVPARQSSPPGQANDITGDRSINYADAVNASMVWSQVREADRVCDVARILNVDTNHDRCVDVTDVQTVSALLVDSHSGRTVPAPTTPDSPMLAAPTATTLTVTSVGDQADTQLGDGICLTLTLTCTLRAAMQEANAHAGPDTIAFNISGSGVKTIRIERALPTLSDTSGGTTIDGFTQPGSQPNSQSYGSNATLRLQLAGSTQLDGILISSANNQIRGLAIYEVRRPIHLFGRGATQNAIVGNVLGTTIGMTYTGAFISGGSGVVIGQGASANMVGSARPEDRNVVSGNHQNGISLYDEGTEHNTIRGNIIGLSADGSRSVANFSHGIDINALSSYNLVGGTEMGEGNVVSGNHGEGIEISHGTFTTQNQVLGNFVGTDLQGLRATASTANQYNGIHIEDGPTNNVVAYNVVGKSASRCCDKGGITIEGFYTEGNLIANNRIGVSLDGTPIGNAGWGISVGFHANRVTIGPGNLIANNPVGILIKDDDNDFNTITQNQIFDNASLGIDLAPAGVNLNDQYAHTGPNQRLNFPVIAGATPLSVNGTSCAQCTVEVFLAEPATGGHGQGTRYIDRGIADATGAFIVPIYGLTVGSMVTATATDAAGNTSEFAANVTVRASSALAVAADQFNRVVTAGWGSAEIGGGYTLSGVSGEYSVNAIGRIRLPSAGSSRTAILTAVSVADTDTRVRITTSSAPTGYGQYIYSLARSTDGTEYRSILRLGATGGVYLRASRVVGGTETMLASEIRVANMVYQAGTQVWLRTQVTGLDPTTIRVRAWIDGQPEPASWTYTTTDRTPALQRSGAVGLRVSQSSSSVAASVTISLDNLLVTKAPPGTTNVPNALVVDTWNRTEVKDWGRADVGGVYALGGNNPPCGTQCTNNGPASDFAVTGAVGSISVATPGYYRKAILTATSAQDADVRVRVTADKVPMGSGQIVAMVIRYAGLGNEYRTQLRFDAANRVTLRAIRVVGNVETALGSETIVPGLVFRPGSYVWVRADVRGVSPTVITLKAWGAGQTEPISWHLNVTDSTAALQQAGSFGLRTYLSGNETNTPVRFSFDDLRIER